MKRRTRDLVKDREFRYQFCINEDEERFTDYLMKAIQKDFTVIDKTQLFFACSVAIQLMRGLMYSKNNQKAWDCSRLLDSFNRTLRELDLTRNAKTEGEKKSVDLMVLIKEYQKNEKPNKGTDRGTQKNK